MIALVALLGCAEGAPSLTARTISDFDGAWSFEFTSMTPVGTNGVKCIDGTGQVSVDQGIVVGSTFSEFQGAIRSRGALEGRITEGNDGTFFSIARSQDGRNAFTAVIDRGLPGMAGTWQDIHNCRGTFEAIRV